MAETTRDVVDTWELSEILAALRQIARDAGEGDDAAETEAEVVRRITFASPPSSLSDRAVGRADRLLKQNRPRFWDETGSNEPS